MNKRVLAVAILLTLVISSGAFAASARWEALGGEHRFLIDDENYLVYPGRVHQFSNSLFIIPKGLGDNELEGGALLNVTENMTLAAHYNLASVGAMNLRDALDEFDGINDRLFELDIKTFPDLFWGMKMGNMSLGARLALAMGKESDATGVVGKITENEAGEITETIKAAEEITTCAKALDFSLGATMYKTPVGDLDLGLGIGVQNFTDEDPNEYDLEKKDWVRPEPLKIESTGGLDIAFNARLNKPLGENYTLIPLLSLNIGSVPSAEYDEEAAPDVTEVSYTGGDIGIGFRKEIKEKGTLIAGVECGYGTITYKTTITLEEEKTDEEGNPLLDEEDNVIFEKKAEEWEETTDTYMGAILAGYEFPITKWLIGRGGVSMTFTAATEQWGVMEEETKIDAEGKETFTEEEIVRDYKWTGVDYYYNMGFQTIFRGLTIDVLLKRDIIERGPYFLTGAADKWATNVCVTYVF